MERVALLVDDTQERVRCLLNPESLVIRRAAGVQPRTIAGRRLAGAQHRDDPLLYVGGGWTEMDLDLLFDVELAGSDITATDVRDLTAPLRRLAENPAPPGRAAPVVRFLWGCTWNEPGVVLALAERLERFTPEGRPRRSWLRLRLRRVDEVVVPAGSEPSPASPDRFTWPTPDTPIDEELLQVRELPPRDGNAGDDDSADQLDRPDLLSAALYGSPFLWRLFASFGGVDDPLRMPRGRALVAPPASALRNADEPSER